MFKLGDTVRFDPDSFDPEYWNSISDKDRMKYYGPFWTWYKVPLFTFITEHSPQTGHCILMNMDTGTLYPMCHTNNFKLVLDDEC